MRLDITLKNYRCFADTSPARFTLCDGSIAFIGPNNAGKSSLLRFFYDYRPLFQMLTDPQQYQSILRSPCGFNLMSTVTDPAEVFCALNDRPLAIEFRLLEDVHRQPVTPTVLRLTQLCNQAAVTGTFEANGVTVGPGVDNSHVEGGRHLIPGNARNFKIDLEPWKEAFSALASCLFVGPYRTAHNVPFDSGYFDMTVGRNVIAQWKQYKTGNSLEQNRKALQLTKDLQSLFGFESLEINASSDDNTLKLIVNGHPRRLSDLGSGFSHFFIVLFNAAMRSPAFILIDEPETGLHPSLQLDFLSRLEACATKGILFATHNYGLSRSAASDVYVVNGARTGSTLQPLSAHPRLSEFMGELSYAAYREIGADKVLLVEGVTEIKTLQEFLRKWQKDHSILLLPLGGSAFINADRGDELHEVFRITSQVHALIDSERSGPSAALEAPRRNFQILCKTIGIGCHVLERRALENYMTDAAVKSVFGPKFSALGHFDRLDKVSPFWSKNDNWRIARAMRREDLDGTDLGGFLDML